jgi:lycopene beta-cyclase
MQISETKTYDYIIAGAGCAGLSLLYAMLQEPLLQHKQILLIDKDKKKKHDRTWCFWQKEKSDFEAIVYHKWSSLKFESNLYNSTFNINPYTYKMIKGIDFYNYVLEFAAKFSNVSFIHESITAIEVQKNTAVATTINGSFKANYIFNSTNLLYNLTQPKLLQHFMGWEISTTKPCFDDTLATFMDFTVAQTNGTTFMYVLPTSPTKALVEYTLFTKDILPKHEYETALKKYVNDKLGIQEFEILHEEFGVIPMTKQQFETHHQQKIINIGSAAGCVKASSGYTFSFIQKHTKAIVQKLVNHQSPIVSSSFWEKRFNVYDDTLLEVLLQKKMNGDEIFARIFKAIKPQTVLAFLDNESTLLNEIRIMSSVPTSTFLPIAFKEIFS